MMGGRKRSKTQKGLNICISANSTWITTARVYVLVSAHYPMSALSTVIICRQVVQAATAVAFFFEDDEWYVPVSINLIGRGQMWELFMCYDVMK